MPETFATFYSTDPWAQIDKNQRTWYDPMLQTVFRRNTVYSGGLVPFVTQPLLPMNAQEMVFNQVYDFEPSIGEVANLRYTNIPPSQLDSRQVRVRSTRYAFATAYDKYDTYISYWRQAQAGGGDSRAAMVGLINERVGRQLQETMDLLIRNAFLNTAYIRTVTGGAASTLTANDKFDLTMVDDAILRSQYQNVTADGPGQVRVIGSPAHEYDIVTGPINSRWIELQKYTSQTPLNRYEIGSYHNARFFNTTANTLWNCGPIKYQKKITAAANYRDGAPDPASSKVDGVYEVGQADAAVVRYIQLDAWSVNDADAFAVGDMVTIHRRRVTNAQAAAAPAVKVEDAPPFDDPEAVVRRIVAIDDANNRIVLDKPIMRDFSTKVADNGSGAVDNAGSQYGWVTKGIHLHAAIMVSAPGGVVCATFQPPRVYAPAPLDLYQSVWQVGWDAYLKFQVVKPETFEVVVTAGTTRVAMKKV